MTRRLQQMKAAVARGVSAYCVSCSRYWDARAAGVPGDACRSTSCGSPLSGHSFEDYDGPITDHTRFCFVCGATPEKAIRVLGSPRKFALCSGHLDYAYSLAPDDIAAKPDVIVFTPGQGEVLAVGDFNPLTKVLLEIEKLDADWVQRHG